MISVRLFLSKIIKKDLLLKKPVDEIKLLKIRGTVVVQ